MRIEITIDALVLDGFDAGDRHRLADAVRRAVSERLADRSAIEGLLDQGSRPTLHAGDVVTSRRDGRTVGTAVGGSVADALIGGGVTRSTGTAR